MDTISTMKAAVLTDHIRCDETTAVINDHLIGTIADLLLIIIIIIIIITIIIYVCEQVVTGSTVYHR
jgi:hypothetical protein